jgi:glycosyltransferase involved in cell wall biosynthesis
MRVLCFGTYERNYPRNAHVRTCLRRAGFDVVERHEAVWDGRRDAWTAGLGVAGRLALAEARLVRRPPDRFDAVLVGYPGHVDLPAARRAARGRPVVFDPLVSLGDTFVGDRGRFRNDSPAARALYALDRAALRAADHVVADTEANAHFYAALAGIPGDRLSVCFVGAEERLFQPVPRRPSSFSCLFVGKLIPLHGVATIVGAARLAPEIRFRVVGSGQLDRVLTAAPRNVEHVPWRRYEELGDELAAAGCALGVFGTSAKARRVIPNKAFQALACGVPLVTGDTAAARELLTNGESALLVPPGDPAALAAAVRRLAAEPRLAQRIGAGGLAVYRRDASEDVLAGRWRDVFERLC